MSYNFKIYTTRLNVYMYVSRVYKSYAPVTQLMTDPCSARIPHPLPVRDR